MVRANYRNITKNIQANNEFLLRFFGNLLLGENHILTNREINVYLNDTVNGKNDTIKLDFDTINDTINNAVLDLIKQNKNINVTEISERLNISESTIKLKVKEVKELKDQKIIERIGSNKTGHRKIN